MLLTQYSCTIGFLILILYVSTIAYTSVWFLLDLHMDITMMFIWWRHHQVVTMRDWAVWELQQQQQFISYHRIVLALSAGICLYAHVYVRNIINDTMTLRITSTSGSQEWCFKVIHNIITSHHITDRCRPQRPLYPRNNCLSYEFIIYKIK